ncbi:hypothetical protein Tco_0381556 [Tanacetum coccineum]
MKYLGVPLIAKKLGVNDCRSLIDNVDRRINNWRNKLLSYAGRIQLIASVLSAMQQYWASVYMLPTSVIKDLDKIFKRFLWNSGNSAKGKARAAWSLVCRPKEQGGLGIKPLKKWNEVLLISQLWKIIDRKECLWVKWVDTVKLKGQSIWLAENNCNDNWGWKLMLELRDKIRPYVKRKIRDGTEISMWYDCWSDLGPLYNVILKRARNEARMRDNETISDMIHEGR